LGAIPTQFGVVAAYYWQRQADAGVIGSANDHSAFIKLDDAIASVREMDE
jgi:hypothetical protein